MENGRQLEKVKPILLVMHFNNIKLNHVVIKMKLFDLKIDVVISEHH